MNSALSSHSESIPNFIHNTWNATPLTNQLLIDYPRHSPFLLRFLRRRLFLSTPHFFGEEMQMLNDISMRLRRNNAERLSRNSSGDFSINSSRNALTIAPDSTMTAHRVNG